MKKFCLAIAVIVLAVPAFAQDTRVRCESNGKMQQCGFAGAGTVTLARQLSKNSCIQGKSGGYSGDTIWVDMCATYDALSPTLRAFLDGLTATHSPAKAGGYFAAREVGGGSKAEATALAAAQHPVVRVHPETGRRSVFVNPLFTDKIDGLRRSESDALLGEMGQGTGR